MPNKIYKIDWLEFERRNKNRETAFEDLCGFLFCRRFKKSEGIFGYKNQTGIERDPIMVNKKKIGFQAKYFDSCIKWNKLKESIYKAKNKNKDLNVIWFFINQPISESSSRDQKKSKKQIELEAYSKEIGIEIEWFVPSNFEVSLNQPCNLDLAQIYFGIGDDFGFLEENINIEVNTFLQSSIFIKLPIIDEDNKKINEIEKYIIKENKERMFLISGHPGSGKSILTHYLFGRYSGLNEKNKNEALKIIKNNKARPMRVDLKLCINNSLEDIIRGRQNDYNLRNDSIGFIYLFDGLDELDEERAKQIFDYTECLLQNKLTKKIIFSCRAGNFNRIRIKSHFKKIQECKIDKLGEVYIKKYFRQISHPDKISKLNYLMKRNIGLIQEIDDILMIKLLWDTIDSVDEHTSIFGLIEKKINILFDSNHQKDLAYLNLLNEKKEKIIELNKAISFEFQKKYQCRFSREEIQEIIIKKFPKCDYHSVNNILDYLSSLFFENNYPPFGGNQTNYIYQHRRYQEYFLVLKLKEEYEKNPLILRNANFLTSRNFIENFFIKYLREEYIKNQNIVELIALNLLEVYLGNDKSFGVEDAYHWNSAELLPALLSQEEIVFNELWNSNSCELKSYILREWSMGALEEEFKKWNRNKKDFSYTDNLISMWENGISSILSKIPIFIDAEKTDIVDRLQKNLDHLNKIYKEYKFFENIDENRRTRDPYWSNLENWLYILMSVKKREAEDIFEKIVRKNYKYYNSKRFSTEEEGRERLAKSFFRALLKFDKSKLLKILDNIEKFELEYLLDILRDLEYLPVFLSDKKLQNKIKKIIDDNDFKVTKELFFLGFFKKALSLKLNKNEKKILQNKLIEGRNARKVDWHFKKTIEDFSIVSFALNENNFDKIIIKEQKYLKYYDELALYSALFSGYVNICLKEKNFFELVREYTLYRSIYTERYEGYYLKYNISLIWSYIFSYQKNAEVSSLISAKRNIFETDEAENTSPFAFYNSLRKIDPELFSRITNEDDIAKLENIINDFDDYQSLVDNLFILSCLFSFFNFEKSRDLFIRGMTEGVLRHGWRKDTIVSFNLVESLELLWENNFLPEKELIEYTEKVFSLTLKVAKFTDGKSTWQGPYNVIDILSKYNLPLAKEYKERLIKEEGYYNFSSRVITSILLGLVQRGEIIGKIEEGMREYKVRYDAEGKPNGDSYEQKIIVYVAIAKSYLYSEEDRKQSFEKAYNQVDEMKKREVFYYLNDTYFRELKEEYVILCKKYEKTVNVELKDKDDKYDYKKEPEENFVKELKNMKSPTKRKMSNIYNKLNNYENHIILKEKKSWELLIVKTIKACGNVELFINYLEKNYYPSSDWFTSNTKYFHYGFAYILNNNETKNEAIRHLYNRTGHKGFANMIKVYAELKDKKMCVKLFKKYLEICNFLVN